MDVLLLGADRFPDAFFVVGTALRDSDLLDEPTSVETAERLLTLPSLAVERRIVRHVFEHMRRAAGGDAKWRARIIAIEREDARVRRSLAPADRARPDDDESAPTPAVDDPLVVICGELTSVTFDVDGFATEDARVVVVPDHNMFANHIENAHAVLIIANESEESISPLLEAVRDAGRVHYVLDVNWSVNIPIVVEVLREAAIDFAERSHRAQVGRIAIHPDALREYNSLEPHLRRKAPDSFFDPNPHELRGSLAGFKGSRLAGALWRIVLEETDHGATRRAWKVGRHHAEKNGNPRHNDVYPQARQRIDAGGEVSWLWLEMFWYWIMYGMTVDKWYYLGSRDPVTT